MNITINRDVFAQHIQGLIEVMRMPNSEHVADAHNKAVRFLRAALAAQPSHTEAQRGEPALWRYRDSEQCIKHMDGYTPGEGWEPLYSQDQISSAVNAALKATAPDERVKELEAELAATEIAIAEYRQQCLDNAAEIARLRSESEERLQNCAALVAEIESLRWTVKDALESLDNGMTADCRATLSFATKETP